MWYGANNGEPGSLRELLEDAESIKDYIRELYNFARDKVHG